MGSEIISANAAPIMELPLVSAVWRRHYQYAAHNRFCDINLTGGAWRPGSGAFCPVCGGNCRRVAAHQGKWNPEENRRFFDAVEKMRDIIKSIDEKMAFFKSTLSFTVYRLTLQCSIVFHIWQHT